MMFDVLLRRRFSAVLNPYISTLLKLSYCNSALIRNELKLKELVEEDFSRYNKKSFQKHFIENLFVNKFQEDVLEYPQLDTKEEVFVLQKHVAAAQKLITSETDDKEALREKDSGKSISFLKKHELSGFKLPKMKNGYGYLNSEFTYMQEALGLNPSLSKSISEHEDLGIHLINSFGSDAQKEQYLPKLIRGENIACFAHLEPSKLISFEQGSLETVAEESSDNQSFIISGKKIWVYNAEHADLFILSTNVISSELKKVPRTTLFLIDKKTPGIEIHEPIQKMGLQELSICDVTFNKVVVPSSCVLGKVNEGDELIENVLSRGKLSNGAHCIAIMKKMVNKAIYHCIHNDFFKKDKCEMTYFRNKIAHMMYQLYGVESMTYLMTGRLDSHTDPDVFLESLIVKVFASDTLQFLTQQAIEILGPDFFSDDDLVELSRDSLFYYACDDANDYLRLIISSAGLKYAKDLKEKAGVSEMISNLSEGYLIRKLVCGSEGFVAYKKLLQGYIHEMFYEESLMLEDSVYILSCCTNHLIKKYGSSVLERHSELKLLANIVINIYASAATLARASRAYCLGVRLQEFDRICTHTLVMIYHIRSRNIRSLIFNYRDKLDLAKIGSKMVNCNKYSDFCSISKSLRARN